jgi:hypothetical protein
VVVEAVACLIEEQVLVVLVEVLLVEVFINKVAVSAGKVLLVEKHALITEAAEVAVLPLE